MSENANLHAAKVNKNDEFYTQLNDIENELSHYKDHFKDAVVFCNCDDPVYSNFWKYFHLNFAYLGLRKLISTHFDKEKPTYKLEYMGGNDADVSVGVMTPLQQNGDFRSPECIELLKEATIVVTNPPFSMFREYVAQLMEYGKNFVIIGNRNSFGSDDIFNLIQEDKMWIGFSSTHHMLFDIPAWYADKLVSDPARKAGHGQSYSVVDGIIKAEVNACWYTNCDISKRHEKMILWEQYNESKFPKYDNYDAIEVSKTSYIPCDYEGVMGVPITWLEKHNPDQFQIIGKANSNGAPRINGKNLYTRILIRKKAGA